MSDTHRKAVKQYSKSFLSDVLEPVRLAARGCGYAVAVHGSLSKDIDLIAVPWVDGADSPQMVCDAICEVLRGFIGNCCINGEPSVKPHGRIAYTIVMQSSPLYIDLSIITPLKGKDDEN